MISLKKYLKDEQKLQKLLKNGNLKPEHKEDLYKILTDKNLGIETKFLAYLQIRKNEYLFDIEMLSEVLSLPQIAVKKIFKSEPIEVKFPIALDHKSQLATAFIIPLDTSINKNSFPYPEEIETGLKTIKHLIQGLNVPADDFFVVFDKDFSGKSFMLSVFAGLTLPEEALKSFAFTGVLNEKGEVFSVDYIEKKEAAAEKQGLKLITPEHIDVVDELLYYLGEENIDIPFIFMVKRPEDEPYKSLKKLEKKIKEKSPYFSLEKLKKIFGLKEEDLFINHTEVLPVLDFNRIDTENIWLKQVESFEDKLKNIYSKFDYKNRVLHIALAVPSSLAMALGIKLGAKKPVVIYHYQSDEYIPVLNLSDLNSLRKIKHINKNKEYKNIDVIFPEKFKSKEDVAVAIWLASHSLYSDVEDYLNKTGKNYDLIKIEAKSYQGNLPLPQTSEGVDEDYWTWFILEIYSTLNILKNQEGVKSITFSLVFLFLWLLLLEWLSDISGMVLFIT